MWNSFPILTPFAADPAHPAFLQTISTDARAVAIVDGIAYVATSGGLESYDLLTAEPLQNLSLAGGAVSDHAGDFPGSVQNKVDVADLGACSHADRCGGRGRVASRGATDT